MSRESISVWREGDDSPPLHAIAAKRVTRRNRGMRITSTVDIVGRDARTYRALEKASNNE